MQINLENCPTEIKAAMMSRIDSLADLMRMSSASKHYRACAPLAIYMQLKGFSKQIKQQAPGLEKDLKTLNAKTLNCKVIIKEGEKHPLIKELAQILSKMPPASLAALKPPSDMFAFAKDLGILYQAYDNPETPALKALSTHVQKKLQESKAHFKSLSCVMLPRTDPNNSLGILEWLRRRTPALEKKFEDNASTLFVIGKTLADRETVDTKINAIDIPKLKRALQTWLLTRFLKLDGIKLIEKIDKAVSRKDASNWSWRKTGILTTASLGLALVMFQPKIRLWVSSLFTRKG